MFKSKTFTAVVGFVISWLVVGLVLPHMQNVQFAGGFKDSFFIAASQVLIYVGLFFVGILGLCVYGLARMLKGGTIPNSSEVTAWFMKQGFWSYMLVANTAGLIVSAISWKLAFSASHSITVEGWSPVLAATFLTFACGVIIRVLVDPHAYSSAKYSEALAEILAKEKAKEEAEGTNKK